MRTQRVMTMAAAVVFGGLVSACSGSLAEEDPNGYEACSLLSESLQSEDAITKVTKGMEAGQAAAKSSSESIREASEPMLQDENGEPIEGLDVENPVHADREALAAACEDEGFDMPSAD